MRRSFLVLGIQAMLSHWAAGETEGPTLTIVMPLDEAEWEVMRRDILPMLESDCKCKVDASHVAPEALVRRLRVSQQTGRMGIDLFAQDNMRLKELVDARLVSVLEDEDLQQSDWEYPNLQDAGVIGGQRYFVPFRPNVQIAYYNVAKFDEYGLQPPRTWPELLEVARAFTGPDGIGHVLFKGGGGAPTTTQLYEWILAAGGDPFDFSHPSTVATFEFLAALRPYLSPESLHADWATTNEILEREKAFLAQNWSFGMNRLIEVNKETPIRTYMGWAGPAGHAHVIGGDMLGIPVRTPKRALALEMIKYLQSDEVQNALSEKLGWPRLWSGVPDLKNELKRSHAEVVQEALSYGVIRANVGYWARYERLASEAVKRILWRNQDPEMVLPPIAERLDALTKGE